MLVILFGKMMRKVFFGQLRAAEMEVTFVSFLYSVNHAINFIRGKSLGLSRCFKGSKKNLVF